MEFFYTYFEQLIEHLSNRSQDIVRERFGSVDGRAKTLEEIGKKYRITRERVRQIIRSALREIQSHGKDTLRKAKDAIEATLRSKSGIMSEEDLIKSLEQGNAREVAALRFFLECLMKERLIKESVRMRRSYALKDFSMNEWKEALDNIIYVLMQNKEAIDTVLLFEKFSQKHSSPTMTMNKFVDFIAVSKEVKYNAFGKCGLASWSDISPKGTREKAYLVMKSLHKPLHFRDITALIDLHGLSKNGSKKTHPQTVHNELIKDARFILVGRGIYALSEWGYAQGTVREVVGEVLRKNETPMKRIDIIKQVLALRQVKKSTVVINLNTFFAKVGKDAYTLKR
jgi:DNA-directed RNA polymerase delta subunit